MSNPRTLWILPLLVTLSGCLANTNMALSTQATSTYNVTNLSKIATGMSEAEVLKIMRHPMKQESFLHGGHTYDVWFYVTQGTGLDQSRLVPHNLTPLTFKDGVLIGWGFSHYNYLIKQDRLPKASDKKPIKEEPPEKKIEKILETAPKEPSASKNQYPEKIIRVDETPGKAQQKKWEPPSGGEYSPPQQGPQLKPLEEPKPLKEPKEPKQPQLKEPKPPQQPKQPEIKPVEKPPAPQYPPIQPAVPGQTVVPPEQISQAQVGPAKGGPAPEPLPEDEPKKPAPKDQPYLDDEGKKMIEEENEENFDFW